MRISLLGHNSAGAVIESRTQRGASLGGWTLPYIAIVSKLGLLLRACDLCVRLCPTQHQQRCAADAQRLQRPNQRCAMKHGLSKKKSSRVSDVTYRIPWHEIRGTERSVENGFT